MRAYKTKAALPGRLSHFTNNTEEHSTVIDLVNACSFAHISSNYGKSAQHLSAGGIPPSVTEAMARFLSELQICNSPHIEGVRHWLIPPVANVVTKGVLQRSAATSPNFSGDLQSAENSADAWLTEKLTDLILRAKIVTILLCEDFFQQRNTDIEPALSHIPDSRDFRQAGACYVMFVEKNTNPDSRRARINEFNVVTLKCNSYLVKGIFFGDSHHKSPAITWALSPVLSARGHLNGEIKICFYLSSGQISSKILSRFITIRIATTTAMMNTHLLSISFLFFLEPDNQSLCIIVEQSTISYWSCEFGLLQNLSSPLLECSTQYITWQPTYMTVARKITNAIRFDDIDLILNLTQPLSLTLRHLGWRLLICSNVLLDTNILTFCYGNLCNLLSKSWFSGSSLMSFGEAIPYPRVLLPLGCIQPFGSSLAFLRWRFLISDFTAVMINCAFVSPLVRLLSISETTSCGNLALSCCDLLLTEPVAITESPCDRCDSVYAKKMIIKDLKCDSLEGSFETKGAIHLSNAKPAGATNTDGPLTTTIVNVSRQL